MKELQEEFLLTYIFISHSVYLCYRYCDKIFVMDQGEVIDTVEFDGHVALLHHPRSEQLFYDDDPAIPFRNNVSN